MTTDNQPTAVPRVITADPGVQPEQELEPALSAVAEHVEALRTWIITNCRGVPLQAVLGSLDRVASVMPERAIGRNAKPLWMHSTCGTVTSKTIGPALTRCEGCGMSTDKWQALYTLGGAA